MNPARPILTAEVFHVVKEVESWRWHGDTLDDDLVKLAEILQRALEKTEAAILAGVGKKTLQ